VKLTHVDPLRAGGLAGSALSCVPIGIGGRSLSYR
jgi:hypothetical protein